MIKPVLLFFISTAITLLLGQENELLIDSNSVFFKEYEILNTLPPSEGFIKLTALKEKQWQALEQVYLLEWEALFKSDHFNEFDLSLELMQQFKMLIPQIKDQRVKIKYHNALGELYYKNGLPDKAYKAFVLAIKELNIQKTNYLQNVILNNYGLYLMFINRYKNALDTFKIAERQSVNNHNILLSSIVQSNIGVNYIYLGDKKTAGLYFHKSLENALLSKEHKDDFERYLMLGYYYEDLDQMTASLNYLNQAKLINNTTKIDFQNQFQMYSSIARIFEKRNEIDSSLKYLKSSLSIKDSLIKHNKKVKALKFEQDMALQQLASEQKEKDNLKRQKLLQTILIIILFLFLIFIVYSFVQKRKKDLERFKLQERLSQIEKERIRQEKIISDQANAEKLLKLNRKEEQVNQVITHLEKIKTNSEDDQITKEINSSIRALQLSKNDENWKEFEIYFNNIHPNFYKKLLKEHPNLSKNEIRLSALIALNYSSKEIADILNKSNHTVVIARGRLRKKLGITNSGEKLYNHLSNYF